VLVRADGERRYNGEHGRVSRGPARLVAQRYRHHDKKKYAEFSVEASDTFDFTCSCSMFAGPIGRDEYEEYRSVRRGKLVLLVSATARPVPFNDEL
jgi:hypothetical protein